MTHQTFEQSNRSARPVSFYRFAWGNTAWHYCNADRVIPLDGQDYTPIAITEGEIKAGGSEVPQLKLDVPADLPVVGLFRGTPPATRVTLTVRTMHPDDPDQEAKFRWVGPVTNVQPQDNASAAIISRVNGLRKAGLRLTYGKGCKFALYGPGCWVDKALWGVARTVVSVTGNSVQLDAPTPVEGHFNGGMIEWDADGLGTLDARTIERETASDTILLFGRGDGISVGMAVTLYPGCTHNSEGCTGFDNLANYPGLDFMLGESPFDGKSLV